MEISSLEIFGIDQLVEEIREEYLCILQYADTYLGQRRPSSMGPDIPCCR
jgi:hypothetical protein